MIVYIVFFLVLYIYLLISQLTMWTSTILTNFLNYNINVTNVKCNDIIKMVTYYKDICR